MLTQLFGTMLVIYCPIKMAVPSTIKKAASTPINRLNILLTLEDKSRIDNWVLSPNSARPTVTKGII